MYEPNTHIISEDSQINPLQKVVLPTYLYLVTYSKMKEISVRSVRKCGRKSKRQKERNPRTAKKKWDTPATHIGKIAEALTV